MNKPSPQAGETSPSALNTTLTNMPMTVESPIATKGPLLFLYRNGDIQAARDRLNLVPDQRRALFFAEKSRVDFVYNTVALEGNPITFSEVKTLLEGVTVGGRKLSDAEQVLNLNRALSHVITLVKTKNFRIDASTACAIQGIVAREEALEWGIFRSGYVGIEGTEYRPPEANELPKVFANGESVINAIEDPIFRAFMTFLWGSLNQFFYDGNKRTSRFLANGTLMTAGFPPIMILAKDQLAYHQVMTRFCDTQEATEALNWLYDYYRERITGFGFDARRP
jgi:Fic family protein